MPPWPTASSIDSCTPPIASSCAENRCVNPAPINPSPRLRPPHDPSTPLMQRKGLKRRPFLFTPSRLDDSDHFLHNHFASVAALRSLIGFPRNADRLSSGTLIDFTRIRAFIQQQRHAGFRQGWKCPRDTWIRCHPHNSSNWRKLNFVRCTLATPPRNQPNPSVFRGAGGVMTDECYPNTLSDAEREAHLAEL